MAKFDFGYIDELNEKIRFAKECGDWAEVERLEDEKYYAEHDD